MLKLPSIVISAALFAFACNDSGSGKGPAPQRPAPVAPSDAQAVAPAPTPTPGSSEALHAWSGLVALEAVALLPAATTMPVTGYAGKKFHFGAIDRADDWSKIARAGGIEGFPDIDFAGHRIVFAVLDAQTNALNEPTWTVEEGVATLSFEWAGIEPHYEDATPGIFVAVPRGGYDSIVFRTSDGRDLATHSLQ